MDTNPVDGSDSVEVCAFVANDDISNSNDGGWNSWLTENSYNYDTTVSEFNIVDRGTQCGSMSVSPKLSEYRGSFTTTENGRECQRWDAQSPHTYAHTGQNYPTFGLDENYCRNPDGNKDRAWCYTTDACSQWEFCDVPACENNKAPTTGGAQSSGTLAPTSAEYVGDSNCILRSEDACKFIATSVNNLEFVSGGGAGGNAWGCFINGQGIARWDSLGTRKSFHRSCRGRNKC